MGSEVGIESDVPSAPGAQREPLSESGEGIVRADAATTVAAVLVDEALEIEAESGVAADSREAVGVQADADPGIPCCDCELPEDVSDGGLDEEGGEGNSDAPRVESWFICTSDDVSSHSRRLRDEYADVVEFCLRGLEAGRAWLWWGGCWTSRS